MSSSAPHELFIEAVAIILEVEKDVLVEQNLEEIQTYDSLGLIRIAIAVEDIFEVQISSQELLSLRTVGEILSYVSKK